MDNFLVLVRIDAELRQFEAMGISRDPLDHRFFLELLNYLERKDLPFPWTDEEWVAAHARKEVLTEQAIELCRGIDDEVKLVLYKRSGKHIRGILAGFMFSNPKEVFLPIMIEAIERDEPYAYLFITKLPKMIGRDSVPVLLKALKSNHRNIRSNALCALCDLQDGTLLPYIIDLINDPHPTIQEVARKCREELEALKDQ